MAIEYIIVSDCHGEVTYFSWNFHHAKLSCHILDKYFSASFL